MNFTFACTPKGITSFLLKIVMCLLVANLASVYLKWERGLTTGLGMVPLFDFDQEFNVPTFYSALAILFSAALLWVIANDKNTKALGQSRNWKVLYFAFIFLSLDELTSIHNHLGRLIGFVFNNVSAIADEAYISSSRFWMLAYLPLLLIFFIFFIGFFLKLPGQTKIAFLLAGGVFMAGAMGVELLGDRYMYAHAEPDIYYGLLYTLEELLEMVGIILFIRALLIYLIQYTSVSYFNMQVNFAHKAKSRAAAGFSDEIKTSGQQEDLYT